MEDMEGMRVACICHLDVIQWSHWKCREVQGSWWHLQVAIVEPWQEFTSLSKVWESMIRTINISNQPTTKNQQPTRRLKKLTSFHVLTISPWRSKAEKVCVFLSGRKEQRRIVGWIMPCTQNLKKKRQRSDEVPCVESMHSAGWLSCY